MARTFAYDSTLTLTTPIVTAVPLSVSCWFNPSTLASVQRPFLIQSDDGGTSLLMINLTSSAVQAFTNGVAASTSAAPSTGVWNHCAGVWASTTSRAAYLNGANKGTEATSATPSSLVRTNLCGIFSGGVNNAQASGTLAEVAAWNAALTDSEVAALALGVSPLNIRPQNLIAYWPLEASSGYLANRFRNSTADWTFVQDGTVPVAANHAPVQPYGVSIGWTGAFFIPPKTVQATFGGVGSLSASGALRALARATLQGSGDLIADTIAAGDILLRPDADVSDGSWTNELDSNVNLYASIDEATADDNDYIKSGNNPVADICKIALSDPTGGVTAITTPMKLRYRYKKVGHGTINLTVRLLEGTTTVATFSHSGISDTYTTAEQNVTPSPAISDPTNLFLEFEANAGLDGDTAAWVAAVISNGGTVSTPRKIIVDDFVVGLKADGIWSKLDRLFMFAAENEPSALTDMVGLTLATKAGFSGVPSFTADQGFTGVSANAQYINSNFNILTDGVNYTQDSASIGIYDRSTSGGGLMIVAANDAGNFTNIRPQTSVGNDLWTVHCTDNEIHSDASLQGMYIITRTGSTAQAFYKNGSSAGTSTRSSITRANKTITALGIPGGECSNDQVSVLFAGGGLNATEAANFYLRLLTYLAAIGGDELDVDTLAWVEAVMAGGGSVSLARALLVNDLTAGLKDDGIWTKLDRLWILAAENAGSALTDIVAGELATAVNSPTFTTDRGYTGNGSTSYINLNFDQTAGGLNFVQNSATIACWSNTVASSGDDIVGGQPGVTVNSIYPRYLDNKRYYNIASTTSVTAPSTNSDGSGLIAVSRTATSVSTLYRNGASEFGGTEASTGVTTVTYALRGAFGFSSCQCSAVLIASGLNSTEHSNVYSRLRTYMTAVGVP